MEDRHRTIRVEVEDVQGEGFEQHVLFRYTREYHFPLSMESKSAKWLIEQLDSTMLQNGSFL